MAGDLDQLARRDVEQDRAGLRQLVERRDRPAGDDLAAEGPEVRGHGVGDPLRPAPGDRPADGVAGDPEHQRDGGRRPLLQREERVRRQARDQGAGGGGGEPTVRQASCRADRLPAESDRRPAGGGASGSGPSRSRVERFGIGGERPHQPTISLGVGPERPAGGLDRPLEHGHRAVVERVRQRGRGVDQLQPVLGQRQPAQEGRRQRQRVDRRADVVHEAGQGQLGRSGTAADRRRGLDDPHRQPLSCQRDRGGESIRPRAHHDRIAGAAEVVMLPRQCRHPAHPGYRDPNSNRTAPSRTLNRASNDLPDLDLKPLSTALSPSRTRHLRCAHTDSLAGNHLPDREAAPLLPTAASERPLLFDDLGPAQGARAEPPGSFAFDLAPRACPGSRTPAGVRRRPAATVARRSRPAGTGISTIAPESVNWSTDGPEPSIDTGWSRTRRWSSSRICSRESSESLYCLQSTNGHPSRQPEQPKPRLPSMTGRPQRGHSPSRPSSTVTAVAGADQAGGITGDLVHELARVEAAGLDRPQLRLPLARQLRGLQGAVLDQGDEVSPQIGRGQRLLRPRDVAALEEGLNDGGARRWRPQAAFLERLLELLVGDQLPRRLHGPEQGALGEVFRRRGLARPEERFVWAGLARTELGELLLVLVVSLVLVGSTGIEHGPPRIDDTDAPRAERDLVRFPGDDRHVLDARGIEDRDQAGDDGVVDLARRRGELARPLAGRDDRVVVAHLLVVDDLTREGQGLEVEPADLVRPDRPEVAQDARDLGLHVAAQVARVGPRVRDRLPLVERLGRLQGRVGRHPVPTVHVPLQLGQVVEQRRLDPLLLARDVADDEGVTLHAPEPLLALGFLPEAVAREREEDAAIAGHQLPEGLRLEGADLVVATSDQGEHRRLDPAGAPQEAASPVADGVVARRVQSHDPVGLAPAPRRGVERVVVGGRPELAEGVANRALGQGAEPEAADRRPAPVISRM